MPDVSDNNELVAESPIETPLSPNKKVRERVRKIVEDCKRKKPIFWQTLRAHSLEYTEILGLLPADIEALIVEEMGKSIEDREGFYPITIENNEFVFIPTCDFSVNYGYPNEPIHLKDRFLIMAYCLNDQKLNESNGQIKTGPVIETDIIVDSYADDYEEPPTWTNIVTEEWHQKIIEELKKEPP